MAEERSALLVLDFQVGIGDQPWAQSAAANARDAVASARERGVLVVFSRVGFEPGYLDVSPSSKAFWTFRENDTLPPQRSLLVDGFAATAGDALVVKNRFSPFAGSKLRSILRSERITHIALTGVSTSGVVLGAFTAAEDDDLEVTVLSDACADPDSDLHHVLLEKIFPRSATVQTTERWLAY